jgi:hypothetical protein
MIPHVFLFFSRHLLASVVSGKRIRRHIPAIAASLANAFFVTLLKDERLRRFRENLRSVDNEAGRGLPADRRGN